MEFIFMIFFAVFFVAFFVIFFSNISKSIKEQRHNRTSPLLSVPATVVTKRTMVRGDHSHTYYFATFEFESGDRAELRVDGYQFGMLVEGDKGKLTFRGTEYVDFVRE